MSEELRKTLETVRDAIVNADPNVLTCTLWMPSGTETVVDYIDARLARVSPSQAGHEGLVTLPRTSTPEMNIAGGIAIQAARASAETPVDLAHACYEAMKGAAPSFLSQAGEPVAVAVKPLEWVETPYGAYAETAFGTAEACTDGLWTFAGMGTHEAGDISDAQASVQDAYEALIRSYLVSAPPAAPAAEVDALSPAARDVLAERCRQIETEGWTSAHDDAHSAGEMATAGALYALNVGHLGIPLKDRIGGVPNLWPWDREWWKPKGRRRDLVRAAALIVAEVERLDRAAGITDTSQKEG